MQVSTLCLLLAVAAAPEVEVVLLDGSQHSGTLQALSAEAITLGVGDEPLTLEARNVIEIRFPRAAGEDGLTQERSIEVRLIDGSLIYCTSYRATNDLATATSPLLGELELPRARLASVRLAELKDISEKWEIARQRESRTDLLIVRKNDLLDFLSGVVGEVTDETVSVLVNNRNIDVPRARVFGLVSPHPPLDDEHVVCELALDTGDRIRLTSVSLDGDFLKGDLASGPAVRVPVGNVQLIDLGLGKLRYLADLQESASYEPVGFVTSEYVQKLRKNGNSLGGPLRIGREPFRRGLWIHSGTTLRYRINRDFRKLQGVLGIERSSENCARLDPRVHVVILGDGETLFDAEVAWGEEPHRLDLDVTGVRDLEIRVLPASDDTIGACEHLAIGDARVVK